MLESRSAQQKIEDTFFVLLRTRSYKKISVSQLCAAAGINRSTFYLYFNDVGQLFESVCEKLTAALLEGHETVKNEETLETFAMDGIFLRADALRERLQLVSGENGDVLFFHTCALQIRQVLKTLEARCRVQDKVLRERIGMAAGFYSVALYLFLHGPFPGSAADGQPDFSYDIRISLFRNVSKFLAARHGGAADLHYTLLVSMVRSVSANNALKTTVPRLLQLAGVPRAEFFLYYKDFSDFMAKTMRAITVAVNGWAQAIFTDGSALQKEALDLVLETEYPFMDRGLLFFFSGSRAGEYYPPMLAGVVGELGEQFRLKQGRRFTDREMFAATHFSILFIRSMYFYFLNGRDYEALIRSVEDLRAVRGQFGFL
ncbi:MAG: TetR/AcrR family transcriptional regulator [Clostridia bacterium]|nr:TetR/AcrR family transcriptional regulator [Clostridia bacterium]